MTEVDTDLDIVLNTEVSLSIEGIESNENNENNEIRVNDSSGNTQELLLLNNKDFEKLKLVLEALLMASDKPMSIKSLTTTIDQHNENPNTRSKDKIKYNIKYIKLALDELAADLTGRAIELKFLGSAYRIQTKMEYAPLVQELWQEKPTRYTKATLETLAIIAYRQPITRGEIEHIRGVAVSSQIIRNLLDREWVKIVGHKELPGRPAIYATTQQFLYDLNLEKLEDLPTLADIKDIQQSVALDNILDQVNQSDPIKNQVALDDEEREEAEEVGDVENSQT